MNVRIVFGSLGLLFAIVLVAHTACAAVLERDWKTPGDGLLTYDDVNRREWLDLSETLLAQYSGSLQTRFETVIAETDPGRVFAGFTPAAASDVRALAESAGIDTSTTSLAINGAAANSLIDLLRATIAQSDESASLGYLANFPQAASISIADPPGDAGFYSGFINIDPSGIPAVTGAWLFRQVVPEPTTTILSMEIGLLLLWRRIRAATWINIY